MPRWILNSFSFVADASLIFLALQFSEKTLDVTATFCRACWILNLNVFNNYNMFCEFFRDTVFVRDTSVFTYFAFCFNTFIFILSSRV